MTDSMLQYNGQKRESAQMLDFFNFRLLSHSFSLLIRPVSLLIGKTSYVGS